MRSTYFVFGILFIGAINDALGQGPPPPPPPQPGLPIDGGIWLLLISGLIYGVYKIRKK